MKICYQRLKSRKQDKKNSELMQENQILRKQIELLRKQLDSGSRISKFTAETLQNGENEEIRKKNTLKSFGSHESLLQIQSYEIMQSTIEIPHVKSLVFDDDEIKCYTEECNNFLSTSIGRKPKNLNQSREKKQDKIFNQKISYREQIQILQNRITYLENQLQTALMREKQLLNSNKKLQLSASMSQRKLDMKESELKEMKRKEKQKIYLQKLYELSSEEDLQAE